MRAMAALLLMSLVAQEHVGMGGKRRKSKSRSTKRQLVVCGHKEALLFIKIVKDYERRREVYFWSRKETR